MKDEYVFHEDRLSTTCGGHKLQRSSKKYYIQFLHTSLQFYKLNTKSFSSTEEKLLDMSEYGKSKCKTM